MKKPLRVIVLCHPELVPPATTEGYTEKEILDWKTEYDVCKTLRDSGHEVMPVGAALELKPLNDAIERFKPDVIFNLLDVFQGKTIYCQNIAAYLELTGIPFTGCNPRGLMLAQGKDLSKTLVRHHRIHAPAFHVFPIGRKVKRPKRLKFPLIVKSLTENASLGISQASVVDSDEKLAERVAFIHERIQTAAIAEEYIDGREIYVGVFGNGRLRALPVWELRFDNLPPGALPIATERAKFDPNYQERRGVEQGRARDLPEELETRIANISKRICTVLELDGYARIDFRLSADNVPYFIEANPNPEIAESEEFAQAALHDGLDYPQLLERILALGIKRAGRDAEYE